MMACVARRRQARAEADPRPSRHAGLGPGPSAGCLPEGRERPRGGKGGPGGTERPLLTSAGAEVPEGRAGGAALGAVGPPPPERRSRGPDYAGRREAGGAEGQRASDLARAACRSRVSEARRRLVECVRSVEGGLRSLRNGARVREVGARRREAGP